MIIKFQKEIVEAKQVEYPIEILEYGTRKCQWLEFNPTTMYELNFFSILKVIVLIEPDNFISKSPYRTAIFPDIYTDSGACYSFNYYANTWKDFFQALVKDIEHKFEVDYGGDKNKNHYLIKYYLENDNKQKKEKVSEFVEEQKKQYIINKEKKKWDDILQEFSVYRCIDNIGLEHIFEKNITYLGKPIEDFLEVENSIGDIIKVVPQRFKLIK